MEVQLRWRREIISVMVLALAHFAQSASTRDNKKGIFGSQLVPIFRGPLFLSLRGVTRHSSSSFRQFRSRFFAFFLSSSFLEALSVASHARRFGSNFYMMVRLSGKVLPWSCPSIPKYARSARRSLSSVKRD